MLSIKDRSSLHHIITPSNRAPSHGGHGTLEILGVIQVLEANDIPCCLIGTSALIYYGADRARGDWHIGVLAHLFVNASSLLLSLPHADTYITAPPYAIQPKSLMHTYPRYKCDGLNLFFQILPSSDFHFDCEPPNFVRSSNGFPYPKLGVFIQSLIDTHDRVALCDVVDGTDVAGEWGLENLDLSGTNDINWAKRKNDAIRTHLDSWNVFYLIATTAVSRRDIWEETVRGKEARLGFKHPRELFATRFRLRASEDPWLIHRDEV